MVDLKDMKTVMCVKCGAEMTVIEQDTYELMTKISFACQQCKCHATMLLREGKFDLYIYDENTNLLKHDHGAIK